MAALMQNAMSARANQDFKKARDILRGVMAVQGENVDPSLSSSWRSRHT
jgi:hypothetical protein